MSVTVQDIKTLLTISTTGKDAAISGAIDAAYAALPVQLESENFVEYINIGNDGRFTLSARTGDVIIVEVVDIDTGTTVSTGDVVKVGGGVYELSAYSSAYSDLWRSAARPFKVSYTSAYAVKVLDTVARDIALYEIMKLPNSEGFMNKDQVSVGDNNTAYRTPADFYAEMNRRLGMVWLFG